MDRIADLLCNPVFDSIRSILQRQHPKLTKQLLLIARNGGIAEGQGNFSNLTREVTEELKKLPVFNPGGRFSLLNRDPTYRLQEFFNNPLNRGAVIMSCFLAPLSGELEEQARLESFLKEVHVTDSDPTQIPFDFTPFFGNYSQPLHADVPHNPPMARLVHESIDAWIDTVCQKTHFPKMSTKLLPKWTREELRAYTDKLVEDPAVATVASIEYLATFYGIYVEGPCELGQRWYPSGVTPRSYFVSGASAHHVAKYTKNMWNDLADSLSVTNKRNRVNPSRIHVTGTKTAVFYDLTSFTSNMSAQRPFLERLSVYCSGRRVVVADGELGLIERDLGDIIREYNAMNTQPGFRWESEPTIFPETHGVAGFLGVFGNIATCNFLHGAVILQCCDTEEECGCAGDDVVVVVEEEETVWACASTLGILALEKTFLSSDLDAVYLKRRTWVDIREFHLRQSHPFQLPSFLLDAVTGTHPITRFRESSMSRRELIDYAANSVMASFRSASYLHRRDHYLGEIQSFMRHYYDLHGFRHEGNVPQYHLVKNIENSRFLPSLDYLGDPEYIERTLESLYPGFATLPDRDNAVVEEIPLRTQSFFRSRGSPQLNYAKRMGFIEVVGKCSACYYGVDGLQRVKKEFERGLDPAWYTYRIIREPPFPLFANHVVCEGMYERDYGHLLRSDVLEYPEVRPGLLAEGAESRGGLHTVTESGNSSDSDDLDASLVE